MDISLKRIVAYIIDILIVSLVVAVLSNVHFLNPYKDEYEEANEKYLNITEDMRSEDFDFEEHEDEVLALNYDIYKYRVYSNVISIGTLILYFGVVQLVLEGQTLGKKIMNIKVISNKDKKLNIGNYLLRIVILNNIIFTVLSMIGVSIFKIKNFYYFIYYLSLIQNAVYMLNILMVVLKKDNRGLHDMVAGTRVIDLKETGVTVSDDITELQVKENETIKEKVEKKERKKKVDRKD